MRTDPHGVPFASVAAVTDYAEPGTGGLDAQRFQPFGGLVGTAVAHEDRFPRISAHGDKIAHRMPRPFDD